MANHNPPNGGETAVPNAQKLLAERDEAKKALSEACDEIARLEDEVAALSARLYKDGGRS